MYMCTQCVRSNTRAQALRGSIVASPHASSVFQNARPGSDAALQMARPHHSCCPPGHGASAASSRTWQARVVAHKPNGCTISLSSSSNEEPVLLHVVGRNILPSRAPYAAVYSFLETGGTLPPMPTPAPTPAPTAILPSLRLRAIMPHLLSFSPDWY
jgi:hypothetical protein